MHPNTGWGPEGEERDGATARFDAAVDKVRDELTAKPDDETLLAALRNAVESGYGAESDGIVLARDGAKVPAGEFVYVPVMVPGEYLAMSIDSIAERRVRDRIEKEPNFRSYINDGDAGDGP